MSPPSGDKQEKSQEKMDEEPKLSIQEQGGACQNPVFHQEQQERICKVILFKQAGLEKLVQRTDFTLYYIYGTEPEIERQIKTIKEFMESKKSPGMPVAFLEVPPDDDSFTFPVPFCGPGHLKFNLEVNAKRCRYIFDPDKALVSIAEIKSKSTRCLDGTLPQKLRLHDSELPACISFSLLCTTKSQLRTPTKFKVCIKTTDEDGKEILGNHTAERWYPVCFYDADADLETTSRAGNFVMEENHDKICELLQNWDPVLGLLVTNGVLDESFLSDSPLSEERKGEILRHLYQEDNIFDMFVEALQTSGGNEELVDFLLQCMSSMENQSYSL